MIARMGLRMARTTHPEYRWRRVAVLVSVVLFLLTLLASASILSMANREQRRSHNLQALAATQTSSTDMFILLRDDVWRGEQYPLIWIQPTSEADPILPVGMTALPEPGQAVVSPALHQLTLDNPELAARYPDHLILDEEGVATGEMLLAYVRAPEGRDLTTSASIVRVSEFGPSSSGEMRLRLSFNTPVGLATVSEGLVLFLILPGSILLTLGLQAASNVRDHRLTVLGWLGMSRCQRRGLVLTETFALALPTLVATALTWALVSPRLTSVPFVHHAVFRGDLAIPTFGYVLVVVITILLIACVTLLAESFGQRWKAVSPRPIVTIQGALSPLRFAPLGFAIVAWATWLWIGGAFGATLFYAGIILALGSIPLLLPAALRPVGNLLGQTNSSSLERSAP